MQVIRVIEDVNLGLLEANLRPLGLDTGMVLQLDQLCGTTNGPLMCRILLLVTAIRFSPSPSGAVI